MSVLRFVGWGTVIGAVAGGAAGLVLGVIAYPPTAWFAILEVGIPSALAGAAVGLVVGAIVSIRRRRTRRAK